MATTYIEKGNVYKLQAGLFYNMYHVNHSDFLRENTKNGEKYDITMRIMSKKIEKVLSVGAHKVYWQKLSEN